MIASEGLQDKFGLLGYVGEEEKHAMLRTCTGMVYLSYYEGFGIPVLEGFYQNKPAVVSQSSSLPEVVGEAGILCDNRNVEEIADSLYELVSNLDRFRSHIPKQIQKFDSANQIKHFMEIVHG
jgi:glycosyltransferase involved in cell wall biosynthesis